MVNGIISAAIFAGINAGAPDTMFGMHNIVHDLAFTGLLLGMLLFACVVPLTRMDLRKNVFSLSGASRGAFPLVSASYGFHPRRRRPRRRRHDRCRRPSFSGIAGRRQPTVMFLKGLVCALGGAVAGWFTISFVVRGQQKADEVAAAMASKTAEAAL